MQVYLDNKQLDALAYACAQLDVHYYTIPSSRSNLVEAFIKQRNGKDISNTDAWYLASFMLGKIERDKAAEEYNKLKSA